MIINSGFVLHSVGVRSAREKRKCSSFKFNNNIINRVKI